MRFPSNGKIHGLLGGFTGFYRVCLAGIWPPPWPGFFFLRLIKDETMAPGCSGSEKKRRILKQKKANGNEKREGFYTWRWSLYHGNKSVQDIAIPFKVCLTRSNSLDFVDSNRKTLGISIDPTWFYSEHNKKNNKNTLFDVKIGKIM